MMDPQTTQSDEEKREPTFAELFTANLRLLSRVALVALAAFLIWRALLWVFPDVAWLRMPES